MWVAAFPTTNYVRESIRESADQLCPLKPFTAQWIRLNKLLSTSRLLGLFRERQEQPNSLFKYANRNPTSEKAH